MKVSKHETKIINFLEKHFSLRDDDCRLIANMWNTEVDLTNLSAVEFLNLLSTNKISSPESIVRCRRRVQELHENLRGENWDKRHKKQKEVIEDLKNNFSI